MCIGSPPSAPLPIPCCNGPVERQACPPHKPHACSQCLSTSLLLAACLVVCMPMRGSAAALAGRGDTDGPPDILVRGLAPPMHWPAATSYHRRG